MADETPENSNPQPLAGEEVQNILKDLLASSKRNGEDINEQKRQNASLMRKMDSLQQGGLTEEGKKARIAPGTTFKEPGCQKAYSRMLPLVEKVEEAERHAAMLLTANPANAHVEHHVELLQAGEHQTLSIYPIKFWVGGVIGGSESVVVCGQLVRSLNVVKMLIYRPCANDVVRGIEVRTYLALCWPCLASDGCALAPGWPKDCPWWLRR